MLTRGSVTTLRVWIASGLKLKIGWPVLSVAKSTSEPVGAWHGGRSGTWLEALQ